jgi:hypothetical protein
MRFSVPKLCPSGNTIRATINSLEQAIEEAEEEEHEETEDSPSESFSSLTLPSLVLKS